MKFDFIIGNPPYQDETLGENKTFAPPIYDSFLECAYKIADCVEMITPARFLFNAGGTSKTWNEKMLSDSHLKVLWYEPKSAKVFNNTDIKGGVAVTYRDCKQEFGEIGTFTAFPELNTILQKVKSHPNFVGFDTIVISAYSYKFSSQMHKDYPEAIGQLSKGHANDIKSNVFTRLPQVFFEKKPNDNEEYVQIFGRENNNRIYKWIKRKYIEGPYNFKSYKVFVPKANGAGDFGEVLSTPFIGTPYVGHTDTFMSIGSFDTEDEAEACLKYIKTKFARAMLDVLKVTQINPVAVWKYIPLQDFTSESDIDWSKSVSEIDQQLYAKYGLSEDEIAFIESHVQEMK